MDESKSSGGTLRSLVVVLALVLVVAAVWAASALAAGGSSSGDSSGNDSPTAGFVQDDGATPDGEDCPERSEDAGASADV